MDRLSEHKWNCICGMYVAKTWIDLNSRIVGECKL